MKLLRFFFMDEKMVQTNFIKLLKQLNKNNLQLNKNKQLNKNPLECFLCFCF